MEFLQPEIETLDRASLDNLQLRKVATLVRFAYENSVLYRERWKAAGVRPESIDSLDSFRRHTPLLGKKELVDFRERRGDPYCGLLCVDPTLVNNIGTSSGTTAEPMPLVELVDGAPPFASTVRDMWGAGLRPGDRVLHCFATQRGPQERVYHRIGCVPMMVNMRMGADWDIVFRMIRDHQPTHIYLLGFMIAELARLSRDHDLKSIFAPIKVAVVTGEPLGARMRARMKEEWGLELFEVTGTADVGVAWDCKAHDGFHIWDDYVYAECLDPVTGLTVADGQPGELVCTALANLAWPLIRYRSGDLVRLRREPCACGRTHTRFHLLGRISDQLSVAGVSILPMQLWQIIERVDQTATAVFQIVHPGTADVSHLALRIGYDTLEGTTVDALRATLAERITAQIGLTPDIELMSADALLASSPSGIKLPRVVKS
ncbi:MAG: phenylacetate-CoA ligase [Gammaproteobacteria bacterium]|jgi:phenylacetate-CoA ligase|nr:phenylacetate-CoA ligase [Gammaproteobacteria bacterium]